MHIIAGIFKNRILLAPKGSLTRPTSSRLRESLFNICQGVIEGAHFLDLFAGSGAIGLEALSRGANKAVMIDSSREASRCVTKNIDSLQVGSQATFICSDVFIAIKRLAQVGTQFDIIFADPPYEKKGFFAGQTISYSQQLLNFLDTSSLLKPNGFLFIEDSLSESQGLSSKGLKTLQLVSARKSGKTSLCEFKKIPLKSEDVEMVSEF